MSLLLGTDEGLGPIRLRGLTAGPGVTVAAGSAGDAVVSTPWSGVLRPADVVATQGPFRVDSDTPVDGATVGYPTIRYPPVAVVPHSGEIFALVYSAGPVGLVTTLQLELAGKLSAPLAAPFAWSVTMTLANERILVGTLTVAASTTTVSTQTSLVTEGGTVTPIPLTGPGYAVGDHGTLYKVCTTDGPPPFV